MRRLILALVLIASLFLALPVHAAQGDCVFSGHQYARVTLPRASNDYTVYIPNFPPTTNGKKPYTYPATIFVQEVKNAGSWTTNTPVLNLAGSWLEALGRAEGGGRNYAFGSANGTIFNGTKLETDTFPGNVLLVTGRTYKAGECWDAISAYPMLGSPPDILTLPAYELGYQTGMNYAENGVVHPAPVNNGTIVFPVLTKPGVQLYIEDQYLELFPTLPMEITTGYNVNVRESGYSSPIIELATAGTKLQLTDYFPLYNRTYGKVLDAVTGKTGWITLVYFPFGFGTPALYLTNWQMINAPVPPG